MPRASLAGFGEARLDGAVVPATALQPVSPVPMRHMSCGRCEHPLECVEQNRRMGTWLGSFICPNCRSEYFYAYRWGRLQRKA